MAVTVTATPTKPNYPPAVLGGLKIFGLKLELGGTYETGGFDMPAAAGLPTNVLGLLTGGTLGGAVGHQVVHDPSKDKYRLMDGTSELADASDLTGWTVQLVVIGW